MKRDGRLRAVRTSSSITPPIAPTDSKFLLENGTDRLLLETGDALLLLET